MLKKLVALAMVFALLVCVASAEEPLYSMEDIAEEIQRLHGYKPLIEYEENVFNNGDGAIMVSILHRPIDGEYGMREDVIKENEYYVDMYTFNYLTRHAKLTVYPWECVVSLEQYDPRIHAESQLDDMLNWYSIPEMLEQFKLYNPDFVLPEIFLREDVVEGYDLVWLEDGKEHYHWIGDWRVSKDGYILIRQDALTSLYDAITE